MSSCSNDSSVSGQWTLKPSVSTTITKEFLNKCSVSYYSADTNGQQIDIKPIFENGNCIINADLNNCKILSIEFPPYYDNQNIFTTKLDPTIYTTRTQNVPDNDASSITYDTNDNGNWDGYPLPLSFGTINHNGPIQDNYKLTVKGYMLGKKSNIATFSFDIIFRNQPQAGGVQ